MTLDSEFEQALGRNSKQWDERVESMARHLCWMKGDNPDLQLADERGWTSCWECYKEEAETFLANRIMKDHYNSNFSEKMLPGPLEYI